ncbi:MAG: carbohydrate binding domain-containing protein [Planctomycetota bacterium]
MIISRTASSGHYGGSGASLWNSVTAPTINLNGYTLRGGNRLGFTDGGTMVDTTGDVRLAVTDPAHPIFAGIALTDGVMDNLYAEGAVPLTTDETIISRGISINNNTIDDDGTLLATIAEVSADTGPVGGMMIAEYPAGATMQNSSGSADDVLGGPRLVFLTGSREPSGVTGGQAAALYDLYPDGEQMFLNAVDYMLNPPPPPVEVVNILANGGFEDGVADPWSTYGDATLEVVQEAPVEGSNCLHVTVGSAGANFWDAGLQHSGHVFEAGKSYALSIWFKSNSGPFQINMKPERAADPWEGYGSQAITITDEWAEYTLETGVIPDTVDPASITFHIAYAPGDFFVDDAKFYEVE